MSKYCPECGVPDGVEEVLHTEADALRARIAELEQALWAVAGILGADLDGDPTPAALKHPGVEELAKMCAEVSANDYQEALDHIAELEAEVGRLRQECADVVEVSTRWTVADLAMQRVVEAARTCGALRENVLMAPEYRSLRDALRALDEQEERCVMVGCPLRGPHSHDGDAHDNRVSQEYV